MVQLQWVMDHYSIIITVLFGLSEVLAAIPGIESGAVYQLVYGILKTLKNFALRPKG